MIFSSRIFPFLLGFMALFSSSGLILADRPKPIPEVTLPFMQKIPTIDGVIHEEEWGDAMRVAGFMKDATDLEAREGVFWLGSDGKKLYIAVKTALPPKGKIVTKVAAVGSNDVPVYLDDSVELWIDPHRGKTAGDQRYFQIIVNSLGAIFDMAYDLTNKQQPVQGAWRVNWQFSNTVADGWWNVEMAIPLSSIGATEEDFQHAWGFHIARNWQQPSIQTDWAPRIGAFETQKDMAVVKWDPSAPVVRMLGLKRSDGKGVELNMEVKNLSDQPQKAKIQVDHRSAEDQPFQNLKEVYLLQPKEAKNFVFREGRLDGKCSSDIRITSVEGEKTYFRRAFDWQIQNPPKMWTVQDIAADSIIFDIGYFPYHHRLSARVDFAGLKARQDVTGAKITVKAKETGALIAEASLSGIKDFCAEKFMDLPDLKDGTYFVEATLAGGSEVPKEAIRREFESKKFAWEHNNLGITDEVIPPFTPLEVKGSGASAQVLSVLRSHQTSPLGLWNQVISEGVPVLSAPISWEVALGGKTASIDAQPVRFTEKKPNRVVFEADWKANSLTAHTVGEYDIDGMLKIQLDLKENEGAVLDKLDLIIPISPQIASLMHVCTDGVRFNYAGSIPKGAGLVWESAKASRSELRGAFIPYIWVGNERQGICWFADSDRDWMLDDQASTHELYRTPEALILKVHFVTKPRILKRTHKIIFALQATPTKPMCETPSPWRDWVFSSDSLPNKFNVLFLGADYYWGGIIGDGEIYPRKRDFSYYNLMQKVRQTGKIDQAEVDRWMAGYADLVGVNLKDCLNSIKWTLEHLKQKPKGVVVYTNARGATFDEDFMVFQDEWLSNVYSSRAWPTENTNDHLDGCISPVQSRVDYALFYFKKMLESGAIDGIYFDNTFLKSTSNPVTGGAYIAEDGSLRPSTDLFAMREYFKRTAILCHQMGRPWWLNMSHMTNGQIIPINTWVGVNLDWEWHYGLDDFQDRFSRDFIRAESIGFQSGCLPLVLPGIRGSDEEFAEKAPWVGRTQIGVSLVHEIKVISVGTTADALKTFQTFYNFGYGKPECKVFHYWEKDFPVEISGVDAEGLLLENKGKALLLVTDFNHGGKCKIRLDEKRLKLKSGGSFTDMESLEPLASKDYSCEFNLKKHDFRVICYQSAETSSTNGMVVAH